MNKSWVFTIILIFGFSSISLAKVVKEYYPGGKIKYVAHYNSKNVLNGWYKFYFPNGQLKEQGTYKNGRHAGGIKRYTPAGTLLGQ